MPMFPARWLTFAFVLAAMLACGGVLPAAANDGDLRIATPVVKPDGFATRGGMTGAQLGELIQSTLGATGYQQVTTILSTCHSGAGLAPLGGQLGGPRYVVASCGARQTERVSSNTSTGRITGVVPGMLDAIISDPTIKLDDALAKGGESDPRVPKGATAAERAAWEAEQKARYEAYRSALRAKTQQDLDKAKAENKPVDDIARLQTRRDVANALPDWDKGGRDLRVQDPASDQSPGAPSPGQKPIAAGTASNHAIIYQPYADLSGSFAATTEKARQALTKASFTTIDVLTPLTPDDVEKLEGQKSDGEPFSVPDDRATPENLKKKLAALAAKMNENEGLTVIVISHGGLTIASDLTESGAGLRGGAVFGGAAMRDDRIGDDFTSTLVVEEVRSTVLGETLVDLPFFTRWEQPSLAIQTIDESAPSGLPVSVLLNGLLLGALQLSDGGSGFHWLPLSDDFIERLVTLTDVSTGLAVSFAFGGPLDFFKLATFDDLPEIDGGFGYAGISLTAHLDGAGDVPAPATHLLMFVALAGLAGTRVALAKRGQHAIPANCMLTSFPAIAPSVRRRIVVRVRCSVAQRFSRRL